MNKFLSVYITTSGAEEAERIARTLVEERLAACVNYFPCHSVYRWQGSVEAEDEYILLCKTRQSLFGDLKERIREIHSYDVPAIVAIDLAEGDRDYLDWIRSETGGEA